MPETNASRMRKGGKKTAASSNNQQNQQHRGNHQRALAISDKERTDHQHDQNAIATGQRSIRLHVGVLLALHRPNHSDPQPALPHRSFCHHAPGNEMAPQRHEDGLYQNRQHRQRSQLLFSPISAIARVTNTLPSTVRASKDGKAHH